MKQRDRFGSPLKQKLDEFRNGIITMDMMVKWVEKRQFKQLEKIDRWIEVCNKFTADYSKLLDKKGKKSYTEKVKKMTKRPSDGKFAP